MNGFSETQTAETFKQDAYRILIVANKFQTGFDQPLLHTMYVDKKLGGVNAVQTLSRLNRSIRRRRARWCSISLTSPTRSRPPSSPITRPRCCRRRPDPNLLYEVQTRLRAFPVYTDADVSAFAKVYFDPKATQDHLYAVPAPVVERFNARSSDERHDFRGQVTYYVRLYAFLSQDLPSA